MLIRILFGIDALVAAVIFYFFLVGLADGSVSSFNAELWAATIAFVIAALGGGWLLNKNGKHGAVIALLLVLAIPGLLYALFILLIVTLQPRWN